MDNKGILEYVRANSWLAEETDERNDTLYFATREHGSVGNEQFGQKDFNEAHRIGYEITTKFENTIYEVETCDEWVHLTIKSSLVDGYDINNLPNGVKIDGHGVPSFMDNIVIGKEHTSNGLYYLVKGNRIEASCITSVKSPSGLGL